MAGAADGVEPMEEIAAVLRRRREELGITLAEAQAATRIRTRYLEALEKGDLAALPEAVYVRGFLRAYADYLGLEGADLVARFDAWRRERHPEDLPAQAAAGRPAEPTPPRLAPGRRRRVAPAARGRGRFLSRGLLVIVLSLAGLYVLGSLPEDGDRRPPAPPASAPQQVGDGVSGRARNGGGPSPGTRPAGAASGSASGQPERRPGEGGTPSGAASPPAQPVTGEEASLDVRSAAYGRRWEVGVRGPAVGVEVVVRATGRCWVRAVVDGRPAWEAIVQAGEERRFAGGRRVELRLGNPGVVSVAVNGRALPPLGSAPVDVLVTVGAGSAAPPSP